jgi:hypothetical protein
MKRWIEKIKEWYHTRRLMKSIQKMRLGK